ncbi:MAG: hypothetical protein B7Y99_10035 [Caulobacterales bacterium 32-69-10]|nr:MAG: hypothetical protein B7Y99_10035 [Caulobacterales bacterium 32-69-10]
MNRTITMTSAAAVLALGTASIASAASAPGPASSFDRGKGQQTWQNAGYAARVAQCKTPPRPFAIPVSTATGEPAYNPPGPSAAIPGVIAAGQTWKSVWFWQGNNTDGPLAGPDGKMLFANQDAGNVMELDPETGMARIIHDNLNAPGAVSRSKSGALFAVERGLPARVTQLEPTRKVVADSFDGEPIECIGGVLNDLAADSKGGVYAAISGGGLIYTDKAGKVTRFGGQSVAGANGIVLSADEKILYLGNGPVVTAFDVQADGALTNQREFAKLQGGRKGGDGMAIDAEGRLYVAVGGAVDVFDKAGAFLGTIAGPPGLHGVAFGGKDKKTLYAIIFYGGWGSPSGRNRLVGIPVLTAGYAGRAK